VLFRSCQATGCGKSYIILYYIKTIIEKYNRNSNIILFTERIDILNDMFKLKSDINEQIIKWKQKRQRWGRSTGCRRSSEAQ